MAAHIEPVWPEEALGVCCPVCLNSDSRRPTGLLEIRAVFLDPQATLGTNGLAPRATGSGPVSPLPLKRQGNWG